MKYILTINQKAIEDLNAKHNFELDIFDAHLLEFAYGWFSNSNAVKLFEGTKQYTWIAHELVKTNIPLLRMKPDTIYRRMTNLTKLGFFELHPKTKSLGRTFYAPTALLDSIHYQSEGTDINPNLSKGKVFTSDANPNLSGLKSEPTSDENPNYYIKNNNKEKRNNNIKTSAEKSATFENEKIDDAVLEVEPKVKAQSKKESSGFSISLFPANFPFALMPYAEKFFEYRKEIKKPYKSNASITTKLKQFIQETEQHGVQAVIESIETAIGQGWIGTFIDKKYTNNPKQKPTGATIPASDQAQRDELALLKTKCHNKRIDFSNVTGTIQEQIIQIKKLL